MRVPAQFEFGICSHGASLARGFPGEEEEDGEEGNMSSFVIVLTHLIPLVWCSARHRLHGCAAMIWAAHQIAAMIWGAIWVFMRNA